MDSKLPVPKKMGRPKKEIDWALLEEKLHLKPTLRGICREMLLKMGKEVNHKSLSTIGDLITLKIKERFGMTFLELRELYMEPVVLQLRHVQLQVALEDKNVPMLKWLGQQYCDQSDKLIQTVHGEHGITTTVIEKFTLRQPNGVEVEMNPSEVSIDDFKFDQDK